MPFDLNSLAPRPMSSLPAGMSMGRVKLSDQAAAAETFEPEVPASKTAGRLQVVPGRPDRDFAFLDGVARNGRRSRPRKRVRRTTKKGPRARSGIPEQSVAA